MADSANIEVIVNKFPLSGFGEDNVELIPKNEDAINTKKGIRSEETVHENNDDDATLTVSLHQTALASHQFLENLADTKAAFPLIYKDLSLDSPLLAQTKTARIQNRPQINRGKEDEPRVWIFYLPKYSPKSV